MPCLALALAERSPEKQGWRNLPSALTAHCSLLSLVPLRRATLNFVTSAVDAALLISLSRTHYYTYLIICLHHSTTTVHSNIDSSWPRILSHALPLAIQAHSYVANSSVLSIDSFSKPFVCQNTSGATSFHATKLTVTLVDIDALPTLCPLRKSCLHTKHQVVSDSLAAFFAHVLATTTK